MNSPRYLLICSQIDCFGDTDVYLGRAVRADQFAATKVGKKKKRKNVIYQTKAKFLYLFHSQLGASRPHQQYKVS